MYEVPLSISLLDFGMGTLYYVGVKSSYEHAREKCDSKRTYVS